MKRIFLIGYMGAGKTTVGRRLAKSLALTFIDLDAYIEGRYRKRVSELFLEKGEEAFRRIEREMLREVATFEDAVISTGGGAPCFFDNMEVMNRAGTTVYISVAPEELAARLQASHTVRPILEERIGEELTAFITGHLARREPYYRQAHIIYHSLRLITKKEVNQTVQEIEQLLEQVKS